MSKNCINCVKNQRTGLDLLCDSCREINALRTQLAEVSRQREEADQARAESDLQNVRSVRAAMDDFRAQTKELETKLTAANAEVERLVAKMQRLPADWDVDSSLESWFPVTAASLAIYESDLTSLRTLTARLATSLTWAKQHINTLCPDDQLAAFSAGEAAMDDALAEWREGQPKTNL